MGNTQIGPNDLAGDYVDVDVEDTVLDLTKDDGIKPVHVSKSRLIGIAGVLAGVVFLVAANVLGTKFGRNGIWITAWRSLIAASLLGVYVKLRGQHINMKAIKHCFIPAIAFTIHIICFYQAIQETTLTNVVIIRSLQAPLTLLFVGSQFSEKVKRSNVYSAVIAVIGVILTIWGTALHGNNSTFGNILAFFALGAWIVLYIFTKKARVHVGTATFMFITTTFSGLVASIILAFNSQGLIPTSQEWIKLSAMAVCASLGHGFISWAHRYTKLSTASLLTLLTPVGSTIFAAIFFDQSITWLIAIGIVTVLGSVAFVIKLDRSSSDKVQEARLDKTAAR